MQMKKYQKGVTLIALAVMVIVILMIATTTIYSGVISIQESKQKRISIELETVQHAVLENYTKYKVLNDEQYLVGEPVDSLRDASISHFEYKLENKTNAFAENASKVEKYYKLRDEGHFKALGLDDVMFQYIVCYKTGEVMNTEVKNYIDGEYVYTSFN